MMTETVVTVQEVPANNNAAKPAQNADKPLGWIKINLGYFSTVPGLFKIAELILGILCMALASPALLGGTHFFLFVSTVSFIGTLIWVFIYLLSIREALNLPIHWILTEFINTAICTVAYAIAFIVQLAIWSGVVSSWRGQNIAAGVFGLFNTLVYGVATYFLYVEYRNSRTA